MKILVTGADGFIGSHLTVKRLGTGISPMYWDRIIGTKAVKEYREDEMI